MEIPKIFESEYKLACIVWEKEPLSTRELVLLCAQKLGWKRTTTYTQLKRLSERGVLLVKDSIVTSLIPKKDVQLRESREFLSRTFDNSLPSFIAAFTQNKALSKEEIAEIQRLIDAYKEET